MHQIATARPPLPSTIRQDLPPAFDELVLRALAKGKDQRFASASELANALAAITSEVPVATAGLLSYAPIAASSAIAANGRK
jgi:serine/threonine-protein kinase